MKAGEIVKIARDVRRPKVWDYIEYLFEDFFEQKGDFLSSDDKSILGGIAMFKGLPVTVIGHCKGRDINENIECNFGMPNPQGYRKARRIMEQAEKFGRPIITFIDTPGAYPGIEAESNGQSKAIADNLAFMSTLTVPVIAVVTGEGSSGGALAIGVANTVIMLENAIYSILSPEGFASILWKDSARADEAADIMRLTSKDLKRFGVIDEIVAEPEDGIWNNTEVVMKRLDKILLNELIKYKKMSSKEIAKNRYDKFRNIDGVFWGYNR